MGKDITGSLRKVTLDGVTYDASADADAPQVRGQYDVEAHATSGRNMMKMTRRVEEVDSIDLITNEAEFEALKTLSEKTDDFPMSYTTASGAVYRATGRINLGKRQTSDGKTPVKLLPRQNWDAFLS